MGVLLAVLGLAVIYLVLRALRVYQTIARYRDAWVRITAETAGNSGIKVLALGDSVVQGIGASTIDRTFVMLVKNYIESRTGKAVSVTNISVTGATVSDVAVQQLPQIDPQDFDVILLVASANDAIKNVPLQTYEESLEQLLKALPAGKVLLSDVPWVRRRSRYVPVLHRIAQTYGFTIISHDIANQKSRWPFVYVAGDFLHPNDRGYKEIWFGNFRPALDQRLRAMGYTQN